MIESGHKAKCLLCPKHTEITCKRYNVERHNATNHAEFMKKIISDEERKLIFDRKKAELQGIKMKKYLNRFEIVTKASFKISHLLLQRQKPFSDGPIIKEAMLIGMDEILTNHKDKSMIMADISSIQLSRSTVTRRSESMAEEIITSLKSKIRKANAISICLDESTDINDMSQLVVFARIVSCDLRVSDEIFGLIPLETSTTAQDIFDALQKVFVRYSINSSDLVSITTDGAASMVGVRNGLVAKLKSENPLLFSTQCIIHQESLCAKTGIKDAKPFADFIMKVINKCVASGATRHRQFKKFLEENEADVRDLCKMQQVRWLSTEQCFKRFLSNHSLIKQFLEDNNVQVDELNSTETLVKLSFFCDLTSKMGALNRRLQGKANCVWDSFKYINNFKLEIESSIEEFKAGNFKSFQNFDLIVSSDDPADSESLSVNAEFAISWLQMLLEDLNKHFQDFQSLLPLLKFGENIESITFEDLDLIASMFGYEYQKLKTEFIAYKSDIALNPDLNFVKLKNQKLLSQAYGNVVSVFADSYMCETSFSKMNFILNEFRSRLTQYHLECCLIVSCTNIEIDFDNLVASIDCKVSH